MKNAAILILGFVCGAAALLLFLMTRASQSPPTPDLKPPETITVLLHPPWTSATTTEAVVIPATSQDDVFRRLVPEAYYGRINEHISPIVAEATVTHPDETQTRILVREGGKNPAIVSVDGINYFYAKNDSDVFAGATELIRLVREIDYERQTQSKTE